MKPTPEDLAQTLNRLNLPWMAQQYEAAAQTAAREKIGHVEYLRGLVQTEAAQRFERAVRRRIKAARIPVIKTLDQFDWTWPKKINRLQILDIFRLRFIPQNHNIVFLGGVGLGKTHLAAALAHAACLQNIPTLFAPAVHIVNTLSAAQSRHALTQALKTYLAPKLLVMDELGYLPMDKRSADLLFQVISARYEHGPIILTTNTPFKNWPRIFDNDTALTTAILDRLLHHCQTVTIEGSSYRMKDQHQDNGNL